jgi:diacylglycerol kinase (ATP)
VEVGAVDAVAAGDEDAHEGPEIREVAVRVTLVYNPSAGDEQHEGEHLLERLEEAGYDARLVSGRKKLARKLEDPGDLVAVAGGDGSVKEVAIALAGRKVPMAILPTGTANNIAKSLGVLGRWGELIAGWPEAERRSLRVGSVTAAGGTMRFVESAGVGLFAELVSRGQEEVDDNTAGLTGHAIDRALLLLRRITEQRPPILRQVTMDAADLTGEYLMVEAMNIPLLGPNMPVAPGADCGDDLLDLVLVSERERGAIREYLSARLGGSAAPLELPVRRGRRVALQAYPTELHVDDDTWKPEGNGSERDVRIELGGDGEVVEVLVPRAD